MGILFVWEIAFHSHQASSKEDANEIKIIFSSDAEKEILYIRSKGVTPINNL